MPPQEPIGGATRQAKGHKASRAESNSNAMGTNDEGPKDKLGKPEQAPEAELREVITSSSTSTNGCIHMCPVVSCAPTAVPTSSTLVLKSRITWWGALSNRGLRLAAPDRTELAPTRPDARV